MTTPSAPANYNALEAPAITSARLEEVIFPMTIADFVRDLQAKRWTSPTMLYRHYGFSVMQGPSFCHGLMRFLAREKMMSYGQWLKVWS